MIQRYEGSLLPSDDGHAYLAKDVEPYLEFFQVSKRMSELLKVLTFEDNVSKEHQEYLECSNRYQELMEELSAV
jgi:hypothetical protein